MTKKHLLAGVITLSLMSLLVAPVAFGAGLNEACTDDTDCEDAPTCNVEECACLGGVCKKVIGMPASSYVNENMDVMDTATHVIDIIMGFLGLIAVVIVLIGGFQWMTAAGNEDKVKTAKKTLSAGIIGLVIVLAAWGIARFVINLIAKA